MHQIELPYAPDGSILFEQLRDLPFAVFLDSGHPNNRQGRFDIMAAAPVAQVSSEGDATWLTTAGQRQPLADTPFKALQETLARYAPHTAPTSELPFTGGAIGYFSYDLGRRLERLPDTCERDIDMPEMRIGIYLWAVLVDHQAQRTWLVATSSVEREELDEVRRRLQGRAGHPQRAAFRLLAPFRANMDAQGYRKRFERVNAYIHAGDCYQVNLAQRFSAPCEGSSWEAYQTLRQLAPTPFSAYLASPDGHVLSLSPERLLRVRDQQVETKPIKGTRPRGRTAEEDLRLKTELEQSEKDRAENLMIVDLLRNDLGKTCRTGSVRVPNLFAVESYANVHHLVTTVTGELADNMQSLTLLEGCFPGGSITGAPKLRAMEIIEELEPQRRALYCGSIGYIDFNGNMDTSICIRTLIEQDGQIHCWGGGGLVADSQWASEYAETFTKIGNLTSALETHFGPTATARSERPDH